MDQTEILKKAENMAFNLAGGPTKVAKNVLLAIVADFMSSPHPDRERLRRTLQLLQEGSGGHIKRGGSSYGEQVRAAVLEVERALREGLDDGELKSLFGWTARLLQIRRASVVQQDDQRQQLKGKGGVRENVRRDPVPPQKKLAQPPKPLGGLGQKGLSALEQLRKQLEDKAKNGGS